MLRENNINNNEVKKLLHNDKIKTRLNNIFDFRKMHKQLKKAVNKILTEQFSNKNYGMSTLGEYVKSKTKQNIFPNKKDTNRNFKAINELKDAYNIFK